MKKKSPILDLESSRKVFFALGLLIVSAAVLMAFTYKTPIYSVERELVFQEIDIPIILIEKEIEAPLPEPPKQITKPIPPEKQASPFNNNLLQNINKKESGDETPPIVTTTLKPIDPSTISFTPDIGVAPTLNTVVKYPDNEAEFYGSWPGYLEKELDYPTGSKIIGEEGIVYVHFIVEKDGSVTDVKVLNKEVPIRLQKEAIRVVKKSPKWKPGMKDGEYVRSTQTVKISFKMI